MTKPLVSVIIPVFNNRLTIQRAVESVLKQNLGDLEIVVVDDGSTDGGFQYVVERFGRDSRLNCIGPRVNGGPSVARNAGIEASRGAWIALLDGDDAWRPERLTHLLAVSQGADFIADNLAVYDSGANEEVGTQFGSFDIDHLTFEDHLSAWPGARSDTGVLKPIMRRGFLDARGLRYDPAIRCGEDFILYADALSDGAIFRLIEYSDYIYTATYGEKSRSRSAHTRTVTDGALMATKLRELGVKRSASLTHPQLQVLEQKAAALEQLTDMWAFRSAILRRDFGACVRLLGGSSVVRLRLREAAARRLLGPLGPAKQERIVAHKAPARHRAKS